MWHAQQKSPIAIGNDVWIGSDVTLNDGVRIGDGAVVAAASVVTKDVPPYGIMGGNPARLIRLRFAEDIVAGPRRIAWWRFSLHQLAKFPLRDSVRFIAAFDATYEPVNRGSPRRSHCGRPCRHWRPWPLARQPQDQDSARTQSSA